MRVTRNEATGEHQTKAMDCYHQRILTVANAAGLSRQSKIDTALATVKSDRVSLPFSGLPLSELATRKSTVEQYNTLEIMTIEPSIPVLHPVSKERPSSPAEAEESSSSEPHPAEEQSWTPTVWRLLSILIHEKPICTLEHNEMKFHGCHLREGTFPEVMNRNALETLTEEEIFDEPKSLGSRKSIE